MIRVDRSALVPYPAHRMYDIVADVSAYPQFLPWCRSSSTEPSGEHEVLATLHFDYHGIRQRFTTRNRLTASVAIELELVDGPFRQLAGRWTFADLGQAGSKVALVLTYQFASGILERLVGPVFNPIADSLIAAFVRRADQLDRQSRSRNGADAG